MKPTAYVLCYPGAPEQWHVKPEDMPSKSEDLVRQALASPPQSAGVPWTAYEDGPPRQKLSASTPPQSGRPKAVLQWAVETFGLIAADPVERAARLTEETLELAQSQGLSRATVDAIVERVFARGHGDPAKEIGQVAMTLEALAANLGLSVELEAQREFDRVRSIPKADWEARHNKKAAIGIASPCGDVPTLSSPQSAGVGVPGDHISDPNMPNNLRALAARVEAGEDPDDIKGIEALWIYRLHRDRDAMDKNEEQFLQYMRGQMDVYRCEWEQCVYEVTGDATKAARVIELAELNGLFDPAKAALASPPQSTGVSVPEGKLLDPYTVEQCKKLVQARADRWNACSSVGLGRCSESLADECEDIVAAIRSLSASLPPPVQPIGEEEILQMLVRLSIAFANEPGKPKPNNLAYQTARAFTALINRKQGP